MLVQERHVGWLEFRTQAGGNGAGIGVIRIMSEDTFLEDFSNIAINGMRERNNVMRRGSNGTIGASER